MASDGGEPNAVAAPAEVSPEAAAILEKISQQGVKVREGKADKSRSKEQNQVLVRIIFFCVCT